MKCNLCYMLQSCKTLYDLDEKDIYFMIRQNNLFFETNQYSLFVYFMCSMSNTLRVPCRLLYVFHIAVVTTINIWLCIIILFIRSAFFIIIIKHIDNNLVLFNLHISFQHKVQLKGMLLITFCTPCLYCSLVYTNNIFHRSGFQ